MKIFYGIQGTGNGHISRGRSMALHLQNAGIDVTYAFSGREPNQYFDMQVFGDYQCFRGLSFVAQAGKIRPLKTLLSNNVAQFLREVRQLDLRDYDIVLTDFEPVTAWAARNCRKPVIGIGHQYAFGKNTPKAGYNIFSDILMRYFAPATLSAGLHWHPYDNSVLPPIIDTSLRKKTASDEAPVLVYLPFEDQTLVTALCRTLPDTHFIQYAPMLIDSELQNVSLRKTSAINFKRDLQAAKAVVCNSGFELVSECIHMGLPVLVKPLQGQFEQLSNAKALTELGLGSVFETLDIVPIQQWLGDIKRLDFKARPFPDTALAMSNFLTETPAEQISEQHIVDLATQLWQRLDSQTPN